MKTFTLQEISILTEALKAWETQPITSGAMVDMVGMMLCGLGSDPRERESVVAEQKRTMESSRKDAERDSAIRRDQSILLQAKLIEMRNESLLSGDLAGAKV